MSTISLRGYDVPPSDPTIQEPGFFIRLWRWFLRLFTFWSVREDESQEERIAGLEKELRYERAKHTYYRLKCEDLEKDIDRWLTLNAKLLCENQALYDLLSGKGDSRRRRPRH